MPQRQRRRALRLLSLAALGAGGHLALIRAALAAGHAQGIVRMTGNVSIDDAPAAVGQVLRPGQVIETGPDSEAVLVMGEDAFLLHADSSFGMGSTAGVTVLRYLTGRILSVFGKGRKTLRTPTATIGIRGTGCYIAAEETQTYFCLCYGSAEVQPDGAPQQRRLLHTTHHEQPLMIGAGNAPMAAAKVLDHTDDELVMLEALVGRVPPFHGKTSPY
ncbi:hypothetical protein E4K72_22445 [Oxalobacteraceae bacterium OM1]|nr:hypothetical protein E4K72_22445 [Oxalobacteraceae bacterium OM1]